MILYDQKDHLINQLKYFMCLAKQSRETKTIVFSDGKCTTNSDIISDGFRAFTYVNGVYGGATISGSDRSILPQLIKQAINNGDQFANPSTSVRKIESASSWSEFIHDVKQGDKNNSEKVISYLFELSSYAQRKYPNLKLESRFNSYTDIREMINSEKTYSYQKMPLSLLDLTFSLNEKSKSVETNDRFGGFGYFEDKFDNPDALYSIIDQAYEDLRKKQEEVSAKAGKFEVVLAPSFTGVFVHEIIGHGVEADLLSYADGNINNQISSPLVNIMDYAHTAFGTPCPTPVFVDDEGTVAKDCQIIENGILKSYLTNIKFSEKYNMINTGNFRAANFKSIPIIRMRNTAMLPGSDTLKEMIASIKDGYYLVKSGSGQGDSKGCFTIQVKLAFEIKNGMLGRVIKNTTATGHAFDVLKSITMLSDDFAWRATGCGKGGTLYIGCGGPAVKCEMNIGGV